MAVFVIAATSTHQGGHLLYTHIRAVSAIVVIGSFTAFGVWHGALGPYGKLTVVPDSRKQAEFGLSAIKVVGMGPPTVPTETAWPILIPIGLDFALEP